MASKSDQTLPSDKSLSKSDLGTLHSTLYPARNRYKPLGLQIGVEIDEIESIEAQHTNPSDRLLAILSFRLKKAEPITWSDIETALRLDCVGEGRLANSIQKKYGHQFSPQLSVEGHDHKKEKMKMKKGKCTGDVCSGTLRSSDRQNENSDVEVSGRGENSRELERDPCLESEERKPISKGKIGREKAIDERQRKERKGGRKNEKATDTISDQSKHKPHDEQIPAQISKRLKDEKSESDSSEYKTCASASEDETTRDIIKGEKGRESAKEKYSPCPVKKQHSEENETKICSQRNEKQKVSGREEKYVKAQSKENRTKGREAKMVCLSYGIEEDEESDSDDSSEDEEDRDSEQKSSNEEEETEPDDESSPDTSEEEVMRKKVTKDKPAVPYKKQTTRIKQKIPRIAADTPLHLLRYQSDKGGEQEEQPKKRSRRRHRESSMSPTTRGSSSPSSSQEETQKQRRKCYRHGNNPGRKKKKRYEKKKEERFSSTETDDSSPEILRNLTEAETKSLVKVFKSFFGRLCLAIKDPVETAAQLQEKHLISCSKMENIITSPESQQVKAITLVRALEKRIKQRPDKIFIISNVFQENELLQEVGRKMLIEAGNYNIYLSSYSVSM